MHHLPFTLINVLDRPYYDDCHIPHSVCIPLLELESVASKWDTGREIIVYCASDECPLSREAWRLLWRLGFSTVKAYEGGMREWKKEGHPTVGDCKADYLTPLTAEAPLEHDEAIITISAEELVKKLHL